MDRNASDEEECLHCIQVSLFRNCLLWRNLVAGIVDKYFCFQFRSEYVNGFYECKYAGNFDIIYRRIDSGGNRASDSAYSRYEKGNDG